MDEQLQRPQWLASGLLRQAQPVAGQPEDRVTLDLWDVSPPWTQNDIQSVVVCVDGEVIGKPLSKEDGCAVFNWLQEALPDLEYQLIKEIERLDQEDAEEQAEKEGRLD